MKKYPTILFVMAKIMEMNNQEQNQIAMYLYNNAKLENQVKNLKNILIFKKVYTEKLIFDKIKMVKFENNV